MTVALIVFWSILVTIAIGVVGLRVLWRVWPGNKTLWTRLGCDCDKERRVYDYGKGDFQPCPRVNAKGGHQLSGQMMWLHVLTWPITVAVLLPTGLIFALGWIAAVGIGRGTKVITNSMQKAVTS